MTLIALGSVKASPGVTTAALALGASWPAGPRVLVAECDSAGGDLAPRFGLGGSPGLVTLAAAARHETDPATVWNHTQLLPGDLPALAGPVGAEQARAAASALAVSFTEPMGRLARDPDTVVLADCGRLEPNSPLLPLLRHARLLLVLVRPVLAELTHVSASVPALRAAAGETQLVLAGPGPYPPAEITDVLGLPVRGALPADPKAAELLAGGHTGLRGLGQLPLPRAVRTLAADLAQDTAAAATDPERLSPRVPTPEAVSVQAGNGGEP